MANFLFNMLNQNKNAGNNFLQRLQQFMNQVRGRNSHDVLSEMIQQNGITQQQINELQNRAQQMAPQMEILKNMFGFK